MFGILKPYPIFTELAYAYDGRLQLLFAASYTGTARSLRGSVELVGMNGIRLSYNLAGFEVPSSKNGKAIR